MKGRKDDEGEKVAFCEQYNVAPYQSSKTIAMPPHLASNGVSSFVSQASSSNVATGKQNVLSNLTESYYSYCSTGVLISESSLRKSEPLMLEPENDQKPANLTMKTLKYENLEFHNIGEENGQISKNKITSDALLDGNKISEIMLKTEAVTDGGNMFERVKRKRCVSAMDFSSYSSLGVGGCNKPAKFEWIIKEGSTENDLGNSDKKQEISDTVKEGPVRGRHSTPDDVVRVIDQKLFWKARKTIIHQQKIFSFQILELHRLIKVQRLIARSPQKLHEKNFDPNKPPIQFPPMDKLLHATPLNRSPPVAKPKIDTLKPSSEKVHSSTNLLTTSTTNPSTNQAKLAPWFFPPPIGNQWLVPIKSPSEGLVYKPYPGPCFPTNGIAFGTQLGQSYGQHYTMPSGSNFEVEQISSKEPLEKDALALFPLTPSNEVLKEDGNDDRKSRVFKAVPHNRKSAPAYAARIFESLKEEREILRLSPCMSHVS